MESHKPPPHPDPTAAVSPPATPLDHDPSANETLIQTPVPSKIKFMVSYGGRIFPHPNDGHLCYLSGDTKILSLDRPATTLTYTSLHNKISSLCCYSDINKNDNVDFIIKYQLPGEDLDALVSVTNDDDLEHMMHEYDRLQQTAINRPARLRLFLFPVCNSPVQRTGIRSGSNGEAKSTVEKFMDSLNPPSVQPKTPPIQSANNDVDFLFGLDDKGNNDPMIKADQDHEKVFGCSPRSHQCDPQIDASIRELNKHLFSDHAQPKYDEMVDFQPLNSPNLSPPMMPMSYWPASPAPPQQQYMFPAPLYHPQMVSPVNGQGCYHICGAGEHQAIYGMMRPPSPMMSVGGLPTKVGTADGMGHVYYTAVPSVATAATVNGEMKPVVLAGEGKITAATHNLPTAA
ncbi:hypothetical protein Drorol1_Dr00007001 [Drosera rotundifolia]